MDKDSGVVKVLLFAGGYAVGVLVYAYLLDDLLDENLLSGFIGAVIGGLLSLAGSWFAALSLNKNIAKEKKEKKGRMLRALYVEVSARAVRCARDCNTWRVEVDKENKEKEQRSDRRTIIELMKFAPSPLVVYPSLGEAHGTLPPDIEAALSDFHYRLDALHRDFDRFSRRDLNGQMESSDVFHLAGVFWDACVSAKKALDRLALSIKALSIKDVDRLRNELNGVYRRMLDEPGKGSQKMWPTIEDALKAEITAKRPKKQEPKS